MPAGKPISFEWNKFCRDFVYILRAREASGSSDIVGNFELPPQQFFVLFYQNVFSFLFFRQLTAGYLESTL